MSTFKNFVYGSLIVISTFSCTESFFKAKTEAKEVTQVEDYFQKKKMCSEFVTKETTRLEKENKDNYDAFNLKVINLMEYSSLYSVCYSRSKNTCVAFINTIEYTFSRGKKIRNRTVFSARDLFTTNDLDVAYETFDKDGRAIAALTPSEEFYTKRRIIEKNVNCAE